MSVQGLQNPYERLQVLPTTMNWRGAWLVTQTYFKNDVVISPINGASYILANQTAVQGGPDPSADPEFVELSPLSTGVIGLTAGTAIGIDNTNPTNPVISNDGVRTLDGDGVTIVVDNTDPNNPVISSNSITILQQGQGISINNNNPQIPVIGNTGVRQILAADASITVSNPTGIVTLSANGLLGVTQGLGISVTGTAQNPEIANAGVISLAVGAGLSSTGGVNPTIANTGVLTVAAADSSIITSGTAQNVILRTAAPVLVRAFTGFGSLGTGFTPANPNTSFGLATNVPASPNIFRDYLFNGAPDPAGIFMIDMTQLMFQFVGFSGSTQVIQNEYSVSFVEIVPGGPNKFYTSATILNNNYLTVGQAYPVVAAAGMLYFNVADARTAGLTRLDNISFLNQTNGTMVVLSSPTIYSATYYPLGLQ
jgi:hypothetical protein